MKMRFALVVIASSMLVALALGCSSGGSDSTGPDDGDTATETIGPGGGEVDLDGDARLTVPAGAINDTIDFTIEESSSAPGAPQGKQFCSGCYDIGPDGTDFTVPATVTLEYDEGDLGSADEQDVVIYVDDGRGWEALQTTVNESENEASAQTSHLSDFVAMVDLGTPAEGVFAALRVHRGIVVTEIAGRDSIVIMTDFLKAWFDSTNAPCAPIDPVTVDSVVCNDVYELEWEPNDTTWTYMPFIPLPFIEEGETYTFDVTGGDDAPDLTASIDFPDTSPYITDPSNQETVSLGGFTVTWEGTGSGNVHLSIVPQASVDGVFIETANDGSYTFSSGDLSPLSAGDHALVLNYYNRENIDATGYDDDSYIYAGVTNTMLITLE